MKLTLTDRTIKLVQIHLRQLPMFHQTSKKTTQESIYILL